MRASRGTVRRCPWCGDDPLYVAYHDREWGFPVGDDTRLFEKLCLEGFQAGLAWITILRKRDAFRAAFRGFAIDRVAAMLARDLKRRGFRFVGPTTVYAFMQAMGLVNDHLPTCDTRARFAVPR